MTNKCWFIFVYMTENFTFDKNQSLLSKLNLKVTEEEEKGIQSCDKKLRFTNNNSLELPNHN